VGTSAAALLIAALVPSVASADAPCTGVTATGGRFATCFDVGNRLSFTAGSDGFGGGIDVRHLITFDTEPDLVWKLEHHVATSTHAAFEDRLTAVVYRGLFIRHARDGHIVLPLGTPKKIFLPFDIGAAAEVGAIRWRPGEGARIGMVEFAALVDVARSRSFRRRFAIGPLARWEIELDRAPLAITEHAVVPFSAGLADLYLETANGRTTGGLRVEAGTVWRGTRGWEPEVRAEANIERTVLAINDRPIALVLGIRYESATDETIARVGARVVVFDRREPRVRLAQPARPR